MIGPGDLQRWIEEAAPAVRGAHVHRVWRADGAWVLLARHHEGGDPAARPTARVALEVALEADWARLVALPPEDVGADDGAAKKAQGRDAHPFLALARRALVGARVTDLTALPGERIAWLDVARDPDAPPPGDGRGPAPPARARLVVELISRTGNLVLCALPEGGPAGAPDAAPRCLGSLHAGREHRPFTPGTPWTPPPPRPAGHAPAPTLLPEVAPDPRTLALGRAVAAHQRALQEAAGQTSRLHALRRAARQALHRLAGTQAKLEAQLEDAARAAEVERQADLLKAALGTIPRGAREARLHDPERGVEVVLALDPAAPVLDQMQALYKRARKLRTGEVQVRTRLGELDREHEELRALEAALEALAERTGGEGEADDDAALDVLEARLRARGALPKEKAARPKVQQDLGPRSFRTLEGHEVLVGRNDDENDRLTMRVARGNDLFFHARGCPGSHVILRVDPKRPPNHESLLDAATLAVHYSKARNRGACDVSYTPRKWVKKPRGAKPGLVQISNEKTVRAGGDAERLRRVLATSRRAEEDEA